MKHLPTNPMNHYLPLHRLKISTRLLLHPDLGKNPDAFALIHGVSIIGDISPATDFRKNPETEGKTEKIKANIHLVEYGAIRVFTEQDEEGDWIRGIDLNPIKLLYYSEEQPLTEGDLRVCLNLLRNNVTPILADPADRRHIIPGDAHENEHLSYFSLIESQILATNIDLRCLHDISHPYTGPAQGSTEKRIKLGDRGNCVIQFDNAKWKSKCPGDAREIHGTIIRLSLRGDLLMQNYRQHSGVTALIDNTRRLVSISAKAVNKVHQRVISQLEGIYLPIPTQWLIASKSVKKKLKSGNLTTPDKIIALLSLLTPIPLEELRAMDENQRHPSPSTLKRLNKDIVKARDALKPIPVASLFLNPDDEETHSGNPKQRSIQRHTINLTCYGII